MKKTALILITNLTLLLANADLKTDLDHDGKLDKVYFEEKKESVYLVCELSSQNFKKMKSNTIRNDAYISLSKTKSGFKYHDDGMRSGAEWQFRYEKKSKKMRLIGMSRYNFGGSTLDGSGESSVNLLTNQYVGEWNYFNPIHPSLVKIPTIKKKENYPKIYLEDFVSFSIDDKDLYDEEKLKNIQKRDEKYFTTFLEKKFPNYKIIDSKKVALNFEAFTDVVVLESKKKGKPYSELDDGYGRKVVLVKSYVDRVEILAQNDQILGCTTCGGVGVGDPYRGITVKHNYVSFEELYGACVKDFQVTTFKYNAEKEKWYLHKLGVESTFCNEEVNGDPKVETKVKTVKDFGVVEFSEFEDGLR